MKLLLMGLLAFSPVAAKAQSWTEQHCKESLRIPTSNDPAKELFSGSRIVLFVFGPEAQAPSFTNELQNIRASAPSPRQDFDSAPFSTKRLKLWASDEFIIAELEGFHLGIADGQSLTAEVCRAIGKHDMLLVGWQVVDGTKVRAGELESFNRLTLSGFFEN